MKIPVLAVDDTRANLVALRTVLQKLPIELDEADSANAGLSMLLEKDYALALIDVQMPGMDGFEMVELMRGSLQTAHVPVIFITAGGGDHDRLVRGYGAGAVDYITKPYEPAFLISKVRVFADLYRTRMELQAALQREKEANADLSRFAAVASHDLRSPLGKTQRMLGLIRRKYDSQLTDPALRDHLQRLEGTLSDMNALVDALYNLYGVASGEIRREALDTNEVIDSACALLSDDIAASGARIDHPALPAVLGNSDLLRQLFQNLLGNAIKYAREGETPWVEITSRPAEDADRVVLEIRDHGEGFDADAGSSIFAPFARLDHTRKIEGLGIGLATVRKIVEAHEGEISATGKQGEGAVFTLVLPAAPEAQRPGES